MGRSPSPRVLGTPDRPCAVPLVGVPGRSAAVPLVGVPGRSAAVPLVGVPGRSAAVPLVRVAGRSDSVAGLRVGSVMAPQGYGRGRPGAVPAGLRRWCAYLTIGCTLGCEPEWNGVWAPLAR